MIILDKKLELAINEQLNFEIDLPGKYESLFDRELRRWQKFNHWIDCLRWDLKVSFDQKKNVLKSSEHFLYNS